MSDITYTPEAEALLKEEVPKLTDEEYNNILPMLGAKTGEVTLEQVEAMLYTAKNLDEVEQMMYGNSTAKAIMGK